MEKILFILEPSCFMKQKQCFVTLFGHHQILIGFTFFPFFTFLLFSSFFLFFPFIFLYFFLFIFPFYFFFYFILFIFLFQTLRLTGWEASTAEQHVLDQRSQSAQSTQSAQQNDNKFAFDSAEDDASIGSSQKKSTNPACTSPPLSSSSSFSSSSSSSPSSSSPNSSNSNSNSNCSCDKDCLSLQSLEMAAFLNDVRSLQNISGDQVKRFCTVNYIYNSKKLFTALDSVLDVQSKIK